MKINGQKLTEQVYLCFGAGTAGAGITDRIFREMVAQGLSEDEARSRFYMVDRQGLVFDWHKQAHFVNIPHPFDNGSDKLA